MPPTKPPSPDVEYVGRVRMLIVIDENGDVCNSEVLQKLNVQADKAAKAAVDKWRFDPTTNNGRPVMVISVVDFFYWRRADGNVIATHKTSAQMTSTK